MIRNGVLYLKGDACEKEVLNCYILRLLKGQKTNVILYRTSYPVLMNDAIQKNCHRVKTKLLWKTLPARSSTVSFGWIQFLMRS
jgi:hypothetical protein